jgi:hypothetical protein
MLARIAGGGKPAGTLLRVVGGRDPFDLFHRQREEQDAEHPALQQMEFRIAFVLVVSHRYRLSRCLA